MANLCGVQPQREPRQGQRLLSLAAENVKCESGWKSVLAIVPPEHEDSPRPESPAEETQLISKPGYPLLSCQTLKRS